MEKQPRGSSKLILKKKNSTIQKSSKSRNKYKKNMIQDDSISSSSDTQHKIEVNQTSEKGVTDGSRLSILWIRYKPRTTPLIRAGGDWCSQLIDESGSHGPIDKNVVVNLKNLAAKILQNDVDCYKKVEESGNRRSDIRFRKNIFSHGTAKDKLAAHVLRCMESPSHSLTNLNAILSSVNLKGQKGFVEAIDSVKELLDSVLLPNGRVARCFENHIFNTLEPLLATNYEQAEKQLALWYFEEQLRLAYQKLIHELSQASHDTVDQNRCRAVRVLLSLVSSHPDQEGEMVTDILVNKLGDPSRRVASQTLHGLRICLHKQPQLKSSVVGQVERLLYRPNINDKAQYYALCFLKDLYFAKNDAGLAEKLLKLYFGFFKACTKKGEVDTRLMSAILRGIQRSFPYTQMSTTMLEEKLETLYKLCHVVNFSIAVQALQLIYQVLIGKDLLSDRFLQILYRQMHDSAFGHSSANSCFLNLIFKAMCRDESTVRVKAFIKRLLQMSQYQQPHMTCGILYLISEVVKEKPELQGFKEALQKAPQDLTENLDDDDEECFPDFDYDDEKGEVVVIGQKSVTVSKDEISQTITDETTMVVDSKLEVKPHSVGSWFHRKNLILSGRGQYDPLHRNPLYCGAELSSLWELQKLQSHCHPSVAVFATQIVNGDPIEYSGDPMQDFTLMRFLDRFVFKNPKKKSSEADKGGNVFGQKGRYAPVGARSLPVNSKEYHNLDSSQVPVDEEFFHRYFNKYKVMKIEKEEMSDNESVDDDEFEEYLSRMNGGKNTDDDLDDNLDFSAAACLTNDDGEELSENEEGEEDEDGEDGEHEELEEEHEEEEGEWEDDPEGDFEDDEEFDFDEENAEFSDEDDESSSTIKSGKRPRGSELGMNKSKRHKGNSLSDMFASAEDFGDILEDNANEGSSHFAGTSHALANRDRAHAKQLDWEVNQDRFLRGKSWQKRGSNFKSNRGSGQRHKGTKRK